MHWLVAKYKKKKKMYAKLNEVIVYLKPLTAI
jgi:hypothetical protein